MLRLHTLHTSKTCATWFKYLGLICGLRSKLGLENKILNYLCVCVCVWLLLALCDSKKRMIKKYVPFFTFRMSEFELWKVSNISVGLEQSLMELWNRSSYWWIAEQCCMGRTGISNSPWLISKAFPPDNIIMLHYVCLNYSKTCNTII